MTEFDEYIVHGEPGQREKADAWQTAIGLQDVDGLLVGATLPETEVKSAITDNSKSRICTLISLWKKLPYYVVLRRIRG